MTGRNNAFVLLSVVLVAGCAGRHVAPAATDAPAAAIPSVPSGTWHGVITGRELATAASVMPQRATLVLDDGRWTIETSAGNGAGTILASSGVDVWLEGEFVGGEPGPGTRALYFMREVRPGFLGGSARSYFSGHTIDGWILLDQVE